MKKTLHLITFVILLLGFSAYGQNFVRIEKANSPESIAITTDQVLEIRLPSTPSTGYGWYLKNDDRNILVQTGDEEFVTDNLEYPIGSSGTQIMKYIGTNRGTKDMEFVYKRPWEKEARDLETYKITVTSEGAYIGKPVVIETKEVDQSLQKESYSVNGLPSSFSWSALGKCTPCKNQGSCGSCWTFAACGSFESVIKIFDGVERDLAEQWLVNCDTRFQGCSGGMCPNSMFKSGAVYEVDQPYMAANGTCKTAPHNERIKNSYSAGGSVASIKQAIYDYGPVWAAVFVGKNFRDFKPGTVVTKSDGTSINHAIVLVGWDDATSSWILRNSWGTAWGEDGGYMRIKYGISSVGSNAAYIDYKGKIVHVATSVNHNEPNSSVTLFPNPNEGTFTIEGLEKQNNIEIYDVVGKMVYKTVSDNSSTTINLSSTSKGMYYYKITNLSTNSVKQGKLAVN
ncbi:MAG: C1 family peptidase [Bacteroidia bacterium]